MKPFHWVHYILTGTTRHLGKLATTALCPNGYNAVWPLQAQPESVKVEFTDFTGEHFNYVQRIG